MTDLFGARTAGLAKFVVRVAPRFTKRASKRYAPASWSAEPIYNMTAHESAPAKSAERALDVLEYVATASRPPTFLELTRVLRIPKSSLFHLVNALTRRGYLEKGEGRAGYRIGAAVDKLHPMRADGGGVLSRARHLVHGLVNAVNETAGYYERRGDLVECLVAEVGRHPLIYNMQVGERVPLFANSCGKALLATLPDEELHAYIERTVFRPYTDTTIVSSAALMKEVRTIRKTGFSFSNGEYLVGITATARVVFDNGLPVGALNVVVPDARADRAAQVRIQRALVAAANEFETVGEFGRPRRELGKVES